MALTNESISKDIISMKRDLELIKHLLEEVFELSDYAKKALKKARETSEEEYVALK